MLVRSAALLVVTSSWASIAAAQTSACPEPRAARFDLVLDGEAVSVAGGDTAGCVATASGRLWCWPGDRSLACAPPAPTEVEAVRGRAASVVADGAGTLVRLTDGTIAFWGRVGTWTGPSPTRSTDLSLVMGPEGPIDEVVSIALSDEELHVVDRSGVVFTVDGSDGHLVAQPRALDHTASRVACEDVCCALGPDGESTCWGEGGEELTAMLRETPGWVDWAATRHGACVATARRVECTGALRPDGGRFRFWSGFDLLGTERAIALTVSEDWTVCLETTHETRCWEGDADHLRGVRPTRSVVRRRVARGERVLTARVSTSTCAGDSLDAPPPTLTAHATPGRVRFDVHGLISNCGYEPTIDVTIRRDGTVTLAAGDPPPDSPLARCECLYDFRVVVRGIPRGAHHVILLDDGDYVVGTTELTVP